MTYLTCSAQCWLDSTQVALTGMFAVFGSVALLVLLTIGVVIAVQEIVWALRDRRERRWLAAEVRAIRAAPCRRHDGAHSFGECFPGGGL